MPSDPSMKCPDEYNNKTQAAGLGFVEGVNKLLEFRASPDARDDAGRTPIMLALKMRDALAGNGGVAAMVARLPADSAHRGVSLENFDDVVDGIDRAVRCVRTRACLRALRTLRACARALRACVAWRACVRAFRARVRACMCALRCVRAHKVSKRGCACFFSSVL
jgi:hypothetical protein